MPDILGKIEALLFLSAKPLGVREIVKAIEVSESEVIAQLTTLAELRNVSNSGIHLINLGDTWQLVTNPAYSQLMAKLTKEEVAGDLTKPALEALTIIAYRGPITKPEIEAIRGVNCTLIIRNLLIRGLIEEKMDALKGEVYNLSLEALRYLGLHDVKELPSYGELHTNAKIEKLLQSLAESEEVKVD